MRHPPRKCSKVVTNPIGDRFTAARWSIILTFQRFNSFTAMRILLLQHDPLDGPGALTEWALERGHSVTICMLCQGEPLPPLDSFDLLVSLGGPMGAYEEEKHPWLVTEKEYLRQAVSAGKKILGLCLGCQLLADALGGKAFRHTCKEFGWQPIEPLPAGSSWFGTNVAFSAFQWHGDTYSLPPGAVQLVLNFSSNSPRYLDPARSDPISRPHTS